MDTTNFFFLPNVNTPNVGLKRKRKDLGHQRLCACSPLTYCRGFLIQNKRGDGQLGTSPAHLRVLDALPQPK